MRVHRRINSKAIGQAAAPQCISTALSIALTELLLKNEGVTIRNPLGTVAIDGASFVAPGAADFFAAHTKQDVYFPIISTSELVYNAHPTKLGTACIRSAAQNMAKLELKEHFISERMASSNFMLDAICRSIGGGYEIDSTWASIVLIVYLSCDPRGRPLLAQAGLTDIDLQTAYVLEAYGRSEITRRARLRETQAAADAAGPSKKRARKGKNEPEPEPEPDLENMEDESPVGTLLSPHSSNDDQRALATKKRRATRGLASASCSDAHGVLDYWFRALRSEESSVLETLIASSRNAATEAAQVTLERQSGGLLAVAANRTLRQMSASNAVRSVEELVKFVHKSPRDIPAIVAMNAKRLGLVLGIAPIANQASKAVMHACALLDAALQPPNEAHIVILHSSGLQEFAPRNTDTKTLPGISERYAILGEMKGAAPCTGDGNTVQGASGKACAFHGKRAISGFERYIADETHTPILSSAAGITRSVIALRMTMTVNATTIVSANALKDEAIALKNRIQKEGASSSSTFERDDPVSLLGISRKPECRIEPLVAPCSKLGVGLRLNELMRRWMAGRTRKNYPVMVLCGIRTSALVAKDVPLVIDTEPLPMAILTDFSLKALPGITSTEPGHTSVAASLHVCLDGAVRVIDVLTKISDVFQRRALLYVASSQASYIGDVGSAISACSANCSSSNSKKVQCADCQTLFLGTHFDAYVGGLTNVQRCFANTPYTGTIGPRVDTGISPPGLMANFYKSDHRGHGSISLGQEAADQMCKQMAHSHFVEVSSTQYVATPIQTRGVPHGMIPDVHSVLNDYTASLESVRDITKREDESTVDGVFITPVSAFLQALAPDVEGSVDSTLRHAFRDPAGASTSVGRSYMPDTTSESEAIFIEPMWRRPCQASVGGVCVRHTVLHSHP